jgi:uncharacterized phage infection (PIP) family protein YhgE
MAGIGEVKQQIAGEILSGYYTALLGCQTLESLLEPTQTMISQVAKQVMPHCRVTITPLDQLNASPNST